MMAALGWEAWFTLGVLGAMIVALMRDIARPDIILLGSLGLLLLVGVVTPSQAFEGFSNTAVMTLAALFVAAEGIQQTNALGFMDRAIFASKGRLIFALPRLMFSTSILSAFLNNTPIVAMLTPRVQRWANGVGIPTSKLLIPLSYAAIVGGMVTLIGTSTNIVVSGLLEAEGYPGLNMFDLTWIGIPAAIGVVLYFVTIGHRLLPDRTQTRPVFDDGLRECLFEVKVSGRSHMIGQTIEEAGLRSLGDAFLAHVRRSGHTIPAAPGEVLQSGDTLSFVGTPDTLDRMLSRPGLERAVAPLDAPTDRSLPLFEAVIAASSRLVDSTLREANFREEYGGVVLAIQRKDENVTGSLGRITLNPGDLLIIEARNDFDKRWNARRDEFYLVAPRRPEQKKPNGKKAPLAIAILLGMILLVSLNLMQLVTATFAAALGMVATRCLSLSEARKAVDVSVLIVIAAALGLGKAIEQTGLAGLMADEIVKVTYGMGPLVVLAVLYVTTNLLTEMITHKAAAVLMLPVALAAAVQIGGDPKAFALVIAVSAAGSFMTPIGYQTNLMVMAAGGYRFRDYIKVGFPVSLIVMAIALSVINFLWL